MALPWASIIPAIGSLAGGLIGSFGAKKARKRAEAREDTAIARRVADANKAGVHPLYALGAQVQPGPSFNVGAPLGEALSEMGQNVGRAMSATSTAAVRAGAVEKLTIENMGLQNDLLRSQIARFNSAQVGPPMPDGVSTIPEKPAASRPFLALGGSRIRTDPFTTNTQEAEDRWGEFIADYFYGPAAAVADFRQNAKPGLTPKGREWLLWLDNLVKRYGPMRNY